MHEEPRKDNHGSGDSQRVQQQRPPYASARWEQELAQAGQLLCSTMQSAFGAVRKGTFG
jgi:hypothetical protein